MATDQDVPWLYVLSVLMSDGGFARWRVVATASTTGDLKDFLELWVERNRHLYGGQYRVEHIPFVSETEDA